MGRFWLAWCCISAALLGSAAVSLSEPFANFQGLSKHQPTFPPDTSGDVGHDHYILAVNWGVQFSLTGGYAIYDKRTLGIVKGPANIQGLNSSNANTPCVGKTDGSPIVLYDPLAHRWLISELSGKNLCIYISSTSDPVSGKWNFYTFQTPDTPAYPKYAVWSDAYYVTTSESQNCAYALDRDNMLAGQHARPPLRQCIAKLQNFDGFQALTPSDVDGQNPPQTHCCPIVAPNLMVRHVDGDANGLGKDNDFLEVYAFNVNWDSQTSTFFLMGKFPLRPFDTTLCGGNSAVVQCIPQPGTSVRLTTSRAFVMWRLAYRLFDDHESLVGQFTEDVDPTSAIRAAVRLFELRRGLSGASLWELYRDVTIAPDNKNNRWMGSSAMDGMGNIAAGYSVSSTTTHPSILYTGLLAPANSAPLTERVITRGFSETGNGGQWGEYSSMSIDPTDDCTFWYANEYISSSDGVSWAIRIATFRFSNCPAVSQPACQACVCNGGCSQNSDGAFCNTNPGTVYKYSDGFYCDNDAEFAGFGAGKQNVIHNGNCWGSNDVQRIC